MDAREAHDLVFTQGNSAGYIHVKGTNELGQAVNADLKSVDYIMVRDRQQVLKLRRLMLKLMMVRLQGCQIW